MAALNKSQSTFERIARVLAETLQVPLERITPEALFRQDLGADSLDLVEIIIALEHEFDACVLRHVDGSWAEFLDERACRIKTVGEAVEYLELLAPLCCTRALAADAHLREREIEFRQDLLQSLEPNKLIMGLALLSDFNCGEFGWLA